MTVVISEKLVGIYFSNWFDGKVIKIKIEPFIFKSIVLHPEKRIFLKTKSQCRDESFYESSVKLFFKELERCPKKCFSVSGISMPTLYDFPSCDTEEEKKDLIRFMPKILKMQFKLKFY